ncbi:MAG: DUF2283 domain-containing protein [Candidatus Gottesmanbacteria bacterium]|nr:DUF2283 domain-containing protein [Candidatus Gottesmanbacteria bacterium]
MEQTIINSATPAIADLVRLAQAGNSNLQVDYDKEADVLYINFGAPQKSDDAQQGSDGIIRRKKKNKLIGLTVLNASRYPHATN